MANKRRILIVILLIAALGFASWLLLSQPGEPVYQGKTVSFWCDQYAKSYPPELNRASFNQAEIAIQTIGTNAIPILLHMLRAKDSKFKLKLLQLVSKQHAINIPWKPARLRHAEAIFGFRCLGSEGRSALPDLIEMYNERGSDTNDFDRWNIANIFAYIGPAATDTIPLLVQDTTNASIGIRYSAIWTLRCIRAEPKLTVPALTRCLRDPVIFVRTNAAIGLGDFGSDAKSAVPELIKLLADPSVDVKNDAATALKRIDPEAAAKAGVK